MNPSASRKAPPPLAVLEPTQVFYPGRVAGGFREVERPRNRGAELRPYGTTTVRPMPHYVNAYCHMPGRPSHRHGSPLSGVSQIAGYALPPTGTLWAAACKLLILQRGTLRRTMIWARCPRERSQ
jgi:hypothetical protein